MFRISRYLTSTLIGLSIMVMAGSATVSAGEVSIIDNSDRLGGGVFERDSGGLSFGVAGAAWLDYDADGDLDLYLPNGIDNPSALFRNDGAGAFVDVAPQAGLADLSGHSGAAAGDLDNDGHVDLVVLGEGHCGPMGQSRVHVYRNLGDGSFAEIAVDAGIDHSEPAWSVALGDTDNDGDLDVFITGTGNLCTGETNPNRLYLNNGDLTFTEISAEAGVDDAMGACAAGFSDYDRDGDQDLFVGNCNAFSAPFEVVPTPLSLYRNNGDGTFTDVAAEAGLDIPGFWMSVTLGDHDNDGDIDLFATNVGPAFGTPHAFFRNNGDGTFDEIGAEVGVAEAEFGWGASLADIENDGDLDLFMVGSLPAFDLIGPGLGNPGRLLINDGGTFTDRSDLMPINLSNSYTSGLAHADTDGDGAPEFVVQRTRLPETPLSGQPVLLDAEMSGNQWLTVRLQGTESNYQGIGARIELLAKPLRVVREVRAGSSFASTETPWPTFGLGTTPTDPLIRVSWPSGRTELFAPSTSARVVTLVEGEGVPDLPVRPATGLIR